MTNAPIRHQHRPRGRLRRGGTRLGIVGLVVSLLLVWTAGVASAHVTVHPGTIEPGSYTVLTFRVPTESATASTVSLQVTLPSDHPFPSVSVMQVPGWTVTVSTTSFDPPVTQGRFTLTEAVTGITWTADDGTGIRPGEFMEFPVSVGPVPDVPSLRFPAVQTYSDGHVVRWDQSRTASGDQPEHPAPSLTVAVAAMPGPDSTARTLGIIALVLAAAALAVALLGARRRRGPTGRRGGPGRPAQEPAVSAHEPGAGENRSGDPSTPEALP